MKRFINQVRDDVPADSLTLPTRSLEHIRVLVANAAHSKRELEAAGFEQTSSWLAGIDSGSSWLHPDGTGAAILVRNWNLISIKPARNNAPAS